MGWYAAMCCPARASGVSHAAAFKTTRTGREYVAKRPAPKFPVTGSVPAVIRCETGERLHVLIHRGTGLVQHKANKRVAYFEDFRRELIEWQSGANIASNVPSGPKKPSPAPIDDSLCPDSQKLPAFRAFAQISRRLAAEHADDLERWKREGAAAFDNAEWLWQALLQSYATKGGSAGWDRLLGDRSRAERLGYDRLAALSPEYRAREITEVVATSGVRWPNRKAKETADAFECLVSWGGPSDARDHLFALSSLQERLNFLRQFHGIGDKYSRNILMDVFHPDARDVIAIDQRIERVCSAHGLNFPDYESQERFLLAVAHAAGLCGWELDRLMYNFTAAFMEARAV